MDDIKMTTDNGKRSGLQQEHQQRVQSFSESGHESKRIKRMRWDEVKYIIPYSPLLVECGPDYRRQ